MNDEDKAMTETDQSDEPTPESVTDNTTSLLPDYVQYVVLGLLSLVALVATLRLYFAITEAINIWITAEYQPLFQALFNLVILLLVGIGLTVQVRKLR